MPRHIVILGRKIKIVQGKNLVYQGQECLGLCDYDNSVIYLEKNQSKQSKLDTLSHEAIHFFLTLTGIDQRMTEREVEIYCQCFAALFKDLKKHL